MSSLTHKASVPILLTSVFIIAICSILYELLISSISAYFLGSSIFHFSITIGFFLSAMGLGAFLSKYIGDEYLLENFIWFELWLGIIGGLSGVVLYFGYAFTQNYYLLAFSLITTIGTLVGLEIPLLTRIIKAHFNLKDTLAQVLSFDYLGALFASILFPVVLLPYFGLLRTSFFVGLLNLAICLFNLWIFRKQIKGFLRTFIIASIATVVYIIGFWGGLGVQNYLEQFLYNDEIIFNTQSAYQRIVVTRDAPDVRLYLNGNLQFSSQDEHRYHEPLVHFPLALSNQREKILFLGAGDGLAARELLKYSTIKEIHVVDLDSMMTNLARKHPLFLNLNEGALNHKKIKIFNQDAYKFLENNKEIYDVIIIDLPDPSEVSLGKLYSKEFYHLVKKRLARDGAMITQSASPFFTKNAFWCIYHTLQEIFPTVLPITVHVPSFGQWGFNMAMPHTTFDKKESIERIEKFLFEKNKNIYLKYLNKETVGSLFVFDEDLKESKTEINTLDTQKLVQYYEKSWEAYNR
ncbi:MAG: polyamine aminopropyltransferase [Bacteroidetes bacterium]|nr:MAG: polyamine aminopropyltransferase [Bacteroidota bacterium]TAG89950.1 MAG: polyamine aminopropyltransferase [Bacteroidota bacterium]